MQILPIFALRLAGRPAAQDKLPFGQHKWGGGAPEGRDGGASALPIKPLRQSLRDCHLPIWLRKMGRTSK